MTHTATGRAMAGTARLRQKERFIELRATGLSYRALSERLHVSKPTLIAWGRELAREVQNARALRLDELFERYSVAKAKRVEALGRRLEAILAELDRRNLAQVKTEALLALALKYGVALKAEQEPLTLHAPTPFVIPQFAEEESWPV